MTSGASYIPWQQEHVLRSELMRPDLFEEFCKEYTREINRLRIEASSDIKAKEAELQNVKRNIKKIIDAIMDGFRTSDMKQQLFDLEDRKEVLERELSEAEEPPALLHPNMAHEYRKRLDGLFHALQDEQTYLETAEDIRALVGKIVVSEGDGTDVSLWLEGDLAGILRLASDAKTPASSLEGQAMTMLVAGARNRRDHHGLFQAAA